MTNKILNSRLLLRADKTVNWVEKNPILGKGEIGVEFIESSTVDPIKVKVGDGSTAWTALGYISPSKEEINTINSVLSTKVDKEDGKQLSQENFTRAEKTKLAGIAANANNYTLPAATAAILGGVKVGANLSATSDGVLSAKDTTYTFEGGNNKFTVTPSSGTSQTVTVTPVIADASTSASGLMSATDKTKLNNIEATAQVNKLESVSVNGTVLGITDKAVDITVPTKTSQITNDSGFITSAAISGKEDTSNKVASFTSPAPDDIHYPTTKLVYNNTIQGIKLNNVTQTPTSARIVELTAIQETTLLDDTLTTNPIEAHYPSSSAVRTALTNEVSTLNSTINAVNAKIKQADWSDNTTDSWAYIKNKPTLGTAAALDAGTTAGTIPKLVEGGKLPLSTIPDSIMGQLVYGGIFIPTSAEATLTTSAKTKLGITTDTATLTLLNAASGTGGWTANEGIYYIVNANGSFAGIDFVTGDWLISTGSKWEKIDNTDAVTSVNGQLGDVVLDGSNLNMTDPISSTTKTINTTVAGVYTNVTNSLNTTNSNIAAIKTELTDVVHYSDQDVIIYCGDAASWVTPIVTMVIKSTSLSDTMSASYSTDNGTTWIVLPNAADGNVLVATNQIKFKINGGFYTVNQTPCQAEGRIGNAYLGKEIVSSKKGEAQSANIALTQNATYYIAWVGDSGDVIN